MNNFEQRLFLEYFDLFFDVIDFNAYEAREFFDKFFKEFKVKYNNEKSYNRHMDNQERVVFSDFIKNTIYNLKINIRPKNTLMEKKFLILKDIFNLDEAEYKYLKLLLFMRLDGLPSLLDRIIDKHTSRYNQILNNYLGIKFCRMYGSAIEDKLYNKGILINGDRYEDHLNLLFETIESKSIKNEKQISKFLLGKNEKSCLKKSDYPYLKYELNKSVNIVKSAIENSKTGVNILLFGSVGTGKTEFAKLIANSAKIPVYEVKTQTDSYREATREIRILDLKLKQRLLANSKISCILFDEAEDVMNTGFSYFDRSASKGHLNKILETTPVPVIWTTNNIYDVDPAFLRRMTYSIEFEKLTDVAKFNIWNKALKKNNFKIKKSKIKELAESYDIPPSLITNAIETTKLINGSEDDFNDIVEKSARLVTKKKSVKKKNKEFSRNNYNIELVNTDISMEELTENIKKSGKLNFSLCLYGEPGTGKSEYAKYLADNLGIKVIYKKASDLMSIWVGGTEQNIARAFEEAKENKAMLIFDEADSLLQNRNNAGHSWEVTQVNEMLTWMESHEYPFVCTTNLMNSLDEASLRRFTFKIKFDFMTEIQVNKAIEHFFKIRNANVKLKGLTAGDFATVKKKADFMNITDLKELTKMLTDEVKVKKSSELKNAIGF